MMPEFYSLTGLTWALPLSQVPPAFPEWTYPGDSLGLCPPQWSPACVSQKPACSATSFQAPLSTQLQIAGSSSVSVRGTRVVIAFLCFLELEADLFSPWGYICRRSPPSSSVDFDLLMRLLSWPQLSLHGLCNSPVWWSIQSSFHF